MQINYFEVKDMVDNGFVVHWASEIYNVIKDCLGRYLIVCQHNGSTVGLNDEYIDEPFFVEV